jgi:hypothetical protein
MKKLIMLSTVLLATPLMAAERVEHRGGLGVGVDLGPISAGVGIPSEDVVVEENPPVVVEETTPPVVVERTPPVTVEKETYYKY